MTLEDLKKIKPTDDLVLVHMNPGVQSTPSGLLLPPFAQQITSHGKVLAVGPSVKLVAPGNTVLVSLYDNLELGTFANTPVLLIKEKHIEAIIEG